MTLSSRSLYTNYTNRLPSWYMNFNMNTKFYLLQAKRGLLLHCYNEDHSIFVRDPPTPHLTTHVVTAPTIQSARYKTPKNCLQRPRKICCILRQSEYLGALTTFGLNVNIFKNLQIPC